MGTQISSVFPDGDIHNSETQDQFLISMASQNPKNAQPISSELLDFSRQTNNFVLITEGEIEFVHYWQGEIIFVAAFTTTNSPIPVHSYHYHIFKGMNFITINLDADCYQIMNFFMDHSKSYLSRNEFLTEVINNSNPENEYLDSNKNEKKYIGAPSIPRASPLKQQAMSKNIRILSSSALLNIENELSLSSDSVPSKSKQKMIRSKRNKVLNFDSIKQSENTIESIDSYNSVSNIPPHEGTLFLSESGSEEESENRTKETKSSRTLETPEIASPTYFQSDDILSNDSKDISIDIATAELTNTHDSPSKDELSKSQTDQNGYRHKSTKIEFLEEDQLNNGDINLSYLSESSDEDDNSLHKQSHSDNSRKSNNTNEKLDKKLKSKSPKKIKKKKVNKNAQNKLGVNETSSSNQNIEQDEINSKQNINKKGKIKSPIKKEKQDAKVFIGNQIRLQNLKLDELTKRNCKTPAEKHINKTDLNDGNQNKSNFQSDNNSSINKKSQIDSHPKLHIEKNPEFSIQQREFIDNQNIRDNENEPLTHIEISDEINEYGHSETMKQKMQISDSLEISRKDSDKTTVQLVNENQTTTNNNDFSPKEVKLDAKGKSNNRPSIRITHLVEISKYEKPKPKIRIGHLIDISLPEYEPKKRKKGIHSPERQSKNTKNNDDSEYMTIYAEIEPIEFDEISKSPSKKTHHQRSNSNNSKAKDRTPQYSHSYYDDLESNSFDQIGIDLHKKYHQIREYETPAKTQNDNNLIEKKRESTPKTVKSNTISHTSPKRVTEKQMKRSIATSTPLSNKYATPKKDVLTNTPEIKHKEQKTQISDTLNYKKDLNIKNRDSSIQHNANIHQDKNKSQKDNAKRAKSHHNYHPREPSPLNDSSVHSEYNILSIDPSLQSTPVPYSDYSCDIKPKKNRRRPKIAFEKDFKFKILSADPTLPKESKDLEDESLQSSYGILTSDPSLVQSDSNYSEKHELISSTQKIENDISIHEEEEDRGNGSEYFIIEEEESNETYEEEEFISSHEKPIVDENPSEWSLAMNALSKEEQKENPNHDKFVKQSNSSRLNVDDLPNDSDTQLNGKSAVDNTRSILIEPTNSDEDNQSNDNNDKKQEDDENLHQETKEDEKNEKAEKKSSVVSEFDPVNHEKSEDQNSNSSIPDKSNNISNNDNSNKEKLSIKPIITAKSPVEAPTFNEFNDTSDTTSSDLDDFKTIPLKQLDLQTDSSSSMFKLRKDPSGLSSEFEIKKESDFTSEEFEAFSTDSEQNYPTFAEVYKNLQQAKIEREKK